MSRIGKRPIAVPGEVKFEVSGAKVTAAGPKGTLALEVHPKIKVTKKDGVVVCERAGDDRMSKALHGLFRSLIQNMIEGVTKGFERKLEIVGVGFGAKIEGKVLALTVGFSKPVKLPIPENITVALPDPTHIVVTGADKQAVGQFASVVRSARKPEPYKGTGIRYDKEVVRKKAGKAFGSGAG